MEVLEHMGNCGGGPLYDSYGPYLYTRMGNNRQSEVLSIKLRDIFFWL